MRPDQRSERWVFFVGTFVFVLFGLIVVFTHLSRISRARDKLVDVELPRLAAVTQEQLVSYFDLNVRSLRLLSDVYDWELMFSRFAEDPAAARRLADSYASALDVQSLDFVDFERRLVHAYWSSEPIRLDPELERDAWFFDTWDVPDPPETQVTLYYDQDIGGNAVYTDHLLRNAAGTPVGVVGILSDVARLAGHIQRTLIEDEFFFLLNAAGNPMLRVTHDSFDEFGPVYDLKGREDVRASQDSAETIAPLDAVNRPAAPSSGPEGFVSRAMSIAGLGAEGVVFLNTQSRLRNIRLGVLNQMLLLLLAYVVLLGSYIALMSMHARRVRAHATVIQGHRERLDDIISILTHNLSNDLHALRQRFTARERSTAAVSPGAGRCTEPDEPEPDRSSHAILMDMEQVLQNAVYSTQLGNTSVRSAVVNTSAEAILQRLYEASRSAAYAKDQHIRVVNHSSNNMETDEDLLFHLLFNLLGNAVKFSPICSTIACGARDRSESVEFFVIDQGPGFSQDDRSHLFEKHHRLSARPTSGERSTGMGLYVTRQLAEALGVELTLYDDLRTDLGLPIDELEADGLEHVGSVWVVTVPTFTTATV